MITLLTPLHMAARLFPSRLALVTDGERLSYRELYQQAERLAHLLHTTYRLEAGQTVAILCRNHLITVLLLPALTRLGIDVRLLSTDMTSAQLQSCLESSLALLIHDADLFPEGTTPSFPCAAVTAEELHGQLHTYIYLKGESLPHASRSARITVLTSGTTGQPKEASRATRPLPFLPPFIALLWQLHIHRHRSVLIALPLYHGFGLATLIVSLLLGKRIFLLRHFESQQVLDCIRQEQIQVLPAVPAMLSRLLQLPHAADSLTSLRCIISGGDRLAPALAQTLLQQLGPVLYNLYGTSEAGFMFLATPTALNQNHDTASLIGRPISGVQCELRDVDDRGIGTLWVRTQWAMTGRRGRWQCTGDRVSRSPDGLYYHHGRADRLVVCGGENVSLDHIQQTLLQHPHVLRCHAFTAEDPAFGQVIHLHVVPASTLSAAQIADLPDALQAWSRSRLPRAARPHHIKTVISL